MLELKEHQATIATFDLCYRPKGDGLSGFTGFELVSLPSAGGMTDQPAKVMQELTSLESVACEEMREDLELLRKKSDDNGGSRTRN